MPEHHPQDHDLLIRLDQKVDGLIQQVSALTDDHEIRIRYLERYVWKVIGALAVIQIGVVIYLTVKR
jgi:hypothetical protein